MATIGTFIKTANGYRGTLKSLTLNCKVALIETTRKSGDDSPDYWLFAGQAEIGAGWKRQSQQGRDYVSARLDDPSFPAPVNANLTEVNNEHRLFWSL